MQLSLRANEMSAAISYFYEIAEFIPSEIVPMGPLRGFVFDSQ